MEGDDILTIPCSRKNVAAERLLSCGYVTYRNNKFIALADFGKEKGKDYLVSDLQETPAIEDYLNISSDSASYKTTEGDDPVGQYPPSVRLMYYYHPDYLGNVEYITDMDGLPYQYFSYTPWGEEFKSDIVTPNSWDSPYRFNGKEIDDETGLYYYGARYYNPSVSTWLSVDPLSHLSPNQTPYHFVSNNPISKIDPDGRHEWNVNIETGDRVLVSDLGGEDVQFVNFVNSKGHVKGQLNFDGTMPDQNSDNNGDPVIDNTKDAVIHYFEGDGQSVNIGEKSVEELQGNETFQQNIDNIVNGSNPNEEGVFGVDMTDDVFHIGRTQVKYSVYREGDHGYLILTMFYEDGFWDPDFIDEASGMQQPDGMGPNLERGGTPYRYNQKVVELYFNTSSK